MAGCPLSEMADRRCGQCTGPVAWKDARGVQRGRARACSSCPMDGLGLPVCWAACPGPNDGFQTDGMAMVTLGGMPDADAFVERFGKKDSASDGRVLEDAGGSMARGFASALLRLDSRGWDSLRDACARKDAKAATAIMGVPLGMFRGRNGRWEGSAADGIMSRI